MTANMTGKDLKISKNTRAVVGVDSHGHIEVRFENMVGGVWISGGYLSLAGREINIKAMNEPELVFSD